jgi:hypothetical protein
MRVVIGCLDRLLDVCALLWFKNVDIVVTSK